MVIGCRYITCLHHHNLSLHQCKPAVDTWQASYTSICPWYILHFRKWGVMRHQCVRATCTQLYSISSWNSHLFNASNLKQWCPTFQLCNPVSSHTPPWPRSLHEKVSKTTNAKLYHMVLIHVDIIPPGVTLNRLKMALATRVKGTGPAGILILILEINVAT